MKIKCQHTEIIYIGEQETGKGKTLSLYNCLACHSTITKLSEINVSKTKPKKAK